ncbi:MAG: hypothetical protein HKN45_09240 [Flavobacteriales bacterium]|nr:hypothetical protein [Flavobacteriales bacterium]NNK80663.1 hypothetical protein [Flavobacteriales bacterium]
MEITDDSGANVFFDLERKKNKRRSLNLYKAEIFSVTKRGEAEVIFYAKDPDIGYDLSIQEMRYYMSGQDDARQGYDPWPSMAGGFAFGAATVFYLEGGYVPFLTPFIYGFSMQIPYIKIKESSIRDKRNTISDFYVEGYNKTARSKKLLSNFAATMAGVVVSSVIVEVSR